MEKLVKPARLAILALVSLALVVVAVITLYKLQVVEGRAYYEESRNHVVTNETVAAARGNLMDRYGRILVENRVCNNLLIDEQELFPNGTPETIAAANASILRLVDYVTSFGDTYTDTLPITKAPPFEFTDMTALQRVFLDAYLKDKDLPETTSAVELLAFMRERYKIDNSYTAEESRIIAGVRYEINGRYSHGFATADYVFAEDVSMDLITTLMENDVPGFKVVSSFVREYNTTYASHILGYVGMMSPAQLEKYSALGYANDAVVGQSGAEEVFEQYLHGSDGKARITSTATGVVTNTVYTEETVPGNHVYLTLDIGLQEATENALNSYILPENEARAAKNLELDTYGGDPDDYKQLITGGAAVVVDVDSGEPLAIASWPSYELTDFLANYSEISKAENDPLFNRALQGTYAPGSTFKPCTAIAGLNEGKIDTGTIVTCDAVFDKYADYGYSPHCWIYGQGRHGDMNVVDAITNSCNVFFYTVGDYLQISLMARYAKSFGLGEPTGIELYEETGVMTSDQLFQERYGRDVYAGETIAAAIGQAESQFSPLQLAEYCAAVANGGTRHSASILKSVYSYDFSRAVYEREPEILSQVETEPEYWDAVHQGMRGVVTDPAVGSAYQIFLDAPYTVAAKTGTAQIGEGRTNNAVFICFAPYEDPEVAVAVAVEHGSAGASIATIARNILDYYFAFRDSTIALESDGALLK